MSSLIPKCRISTRTASGCRSNSTPPRTASSRRFLCHSRCITRITWPMNGPANSRANSAQSRRSFLTTACGAASTLLAFNAAHARAGRNGGFFEIANDAKLDEQLAASQLGKREFIFDVQGHFVNPTGAWTKRLPPGAKPLQFPNTQCELAKQPGERSYLNCIGPDEFIKDVFLDSDTDLMVLSFVPSTREDEPLTIEEATATRDIVEKMEGSKRLLLHGRVNPNQKGDVEDMDRLAKIRRRRLQDVHAVGAQRHGILDDGRCRRRVRREGAEARRAQHLHSQGPRLRPEELRALDLPRHRADREAVSGHEFPHLSLRIRLEQTRRRLRRATHRRHRRAGHFPHGSGIKPNSNVYAELGSTWRFLSMRDPDSAAHAMGKLFKYVGEDNVLWGTDSIWYGSPQDQIQAFRTFQISEALRDRYAYPQDHAAVARQGFRIERHADPTNSRPTSCGSSRPRQGCAIESRLFTKPFVCDPRSAHAPGIPQPAGLARRRAMRSEKFVTSC